MWGFLVMKIMSYRDKLVFKLNRLREIPTSDEWLTFELLFYEQLTVKEIELVTNKTESYIQKLKESVLNKAEIILGDDIKLLK